MVELDCPEATIMNMLLELPKPPALPPDSLYEVVNGDYVEKKVGARELLLANDLAAVLRTFVRDQELGRVDVEMIFRFAPEAPQRRPDVSFVSFQRWPRGRRVPPGEAWEVVPDLAVEVVSPSNLYYEILGKVSEYFEAGVGGVWLVVPPL